MFNLLIIVSILYGTDEKQTGSANLTADCTWDQHTVNLIIMFMLFYTLYIVITYY